LLAANSDTSGQRTGAPSLWNTRSLTIESSAFSTALLDLKISSTNANSASGSLPAVSRTKRSCSSALRLIGPNSSSGVENLVSSRSK
jgi:hypothetical protein